MGTGRRVAGTLATALTIAVLPAAAPAADEAPIAATANGNAVAGGLSFAPAKITARVGQVVTWTDTDVIAPHTVTEKHGLFDLVGNNVNGTPVSASGFGPGTSVQLRMVAGTTSYYCRVHPGDMAGVLAVPVTMTLGPALAPGGTPAKTAAGRRRRAARRRAFQRTLTVTWAPGPAADGQVYEVQQRRGTGPWTPLTTTGAVGSMKIKAGRRGTVTAVRARLRRGDDATRATDWSPEASVTG